MVEKQDNKQIATFFTHTGAMEFYAKLKQLQDPQVEIGPVPRRFSTSCGTGVRFSLPFDEQIMVNPDLENIYRERDGKDQYDLIWSAE